MTVVVDSPTLQSVLRDVWTVDLLDRNYGLPGGHLEFFAGDNAAPVVILSTTFRLGDPYAPRCGGTRIDATEILYSVERFIASLDRQIDELCKSLASEQAEWRGRR